MRGSLINQEVFQSTLSSSIQAALIEAGEREIQKAMSALEVALRKRLAEMVVGLIEQNYSVERDGYYLKIVVRLDGGDRP